jgi:hypothetical protein
MKSKWRERETDRGIGPMATSVSPRNPKANGSRLKLPLERGGGGPAAGATSKLFRVAGSITRPLDRATRRTRSAFRLVAKEAARGTLTYDRKGRGQSVPPDSRLLPEVARRDALPTTRPFRVSTSDLGPLAFDGEDEPDGSYGAAAEISATFRRKLMGLRRLPRHERPHAYKAFVAERRMALKALKEKSATARHARKLARKRRPPGPKP